MPESAQVIPIKGSRRAQDIFQCQKAASLAFNLEAVTPWEPVIGDNNPPRLELTLGPSKARLSQLTCYVSGQGKASIEWLDRTTRSRVQ